MARGPETANSGDLGRTVISRALAILDAFTPDRRELTLAQICRLTGLRHATAHRLVGELTGWGALERLPTGAYVVGLRLWELGTLNPRGLPLRVLAMPVMEDLHAATRQHVQLAVLDGTDALVVERISSTGAVPVVSQVGGRLPLHASAVGQVLLAHTGQELFTEVVRNGLARFTPRTITDPGALRLALAECRRTGVAVVHEEMSPDAHSVAAPVTDAKGRLVAALSVVGVDARTHLLAPAVVLAGRSVSRSLGSGAMP
ncbi:IclR family transcriptional regulator [Streptomyces caniscabiei]|uniref:IclR family transcriptional regulator n=1 Tax=Streptomyces caniscabiei TaxID=2746961 RepID=UPI0029A58C21|nr:IclR family transcriptional regulator [Streptomyces caniscabiei]MDX2604964.1 IclR family transcriptional regulator [Streptomyces caniscabiei]MDX2733870.1 IclR family transcriptional regulator [Streptomyces caniscabiei]MDX2777320.1 IclR family transcriptional regulator [Streptomyces caniscabiei]